MRKPLLCILTPALADANNGNWQTARRWAAMLNGHFQVHLSKSWPTGDLKWDSAAGLIALHARRSAGSIAAWARTFPDRPLVVTLTGTDLYRDIHQDRSAQESLQFAQRLIVLQEQGPLELAAPLRSKCRVIFQSTSARQRLQKTSRHLRVVMVGHLRDEKWPQVMFEASRRIGPDDRIRIDHIGNPLDPALAEMAAETARQCPHYRWLGGLDHTKVRNYIQRAHLLVHPSRMEGGAHVIMEAIRSGTPVLASKVPGNVGMLGPDYSGYFAPGDVAQLVQMLRDAAPGSDSGASWLHALQAQCDARAHLFEPSCEQTALLDLMDEFNWIST